MTPTQNIKSIRFHKLISPILLIFIPSLIIDAFIEYRIHPQSIFFYKDLINMSLILIVLTLFHRKVIKASKVFMITVYSIVFSLMISLPFRVDQVDFQFEPFFLKVEIILMVLIFAIGVLVHPIHKLIIIITNLSFIVVCFFLVDASYPVEKFVFYAIMVTGTGGMAYVLHTTFIRLTKDLRTANHKISHQNNELRKLNESKNQLFRIIAHDLKTPFAQLSMLVDLINATDNIEEKKELRGMIKESATNGVELLDRLMDWAKVQSNPKTSELDKYKVSTVVNEVFNFMKQSSLTKEIELIADIPEHLELCMDEEMMQTVLRNLVSNAIKFSNRGTQIIVKAITELEEVSIKVIDQGIGIDKDILSDLLEYENKTSTIGTENEQGTGLGLSICKALVESQNGTLAIESSIGNGTTVTIEMPVRSC